MLTNYKDSLTIIRFIRSGLHWFKYKSAQNISVLGGSICKIAM